jgi:hypothetical protein
VNLAARRIRQYLASSCLNGGRGIEGVEAQVSIPSGLPLVGSRELDGYLIVVALGAGFASASPETATTILAQDEGVSA